MLLKNFRSFIKYKPVLAVGFLFAASSLSFGIWVAAIPTVKYRLGFTDATLGLSLLLSPLGAITGVLLSTKIFSKIPVGKWMMWGYIFNCIIMTLQINATNRLMFWFCLYLLGLSSFLNGVSTNATVNIMEKKYNKLFMSTCHGLYSLGGAVSAAFAALFFSIQMPPGWQIVIMAVLIAGVIILSRNYLLANKDIIHSGSGLRWPSLSVLGISFMCMVSFMAEGCVADWSAIYFKEVMHSPKALISIGYAGFSMAMTVGRLHGDAIITVIGNKKAVIGGALLAALGFALVVLAPVIAVAVGGYIIIGFGSSCIVPVLFRTSGNIPGLSKVEGFAMVTTGGLIGFFSGPFVIGVLSEVMGLSKAFVLLIIMMLASALVAAKNHFISNKDKHPATPAFDEQIY